MTFSAAQTSAKTGVGERYLPKIVGLAAKIETSNEVSPHDFFTGTLGGASGAGLVSIASGAREAGFSAYGHPLTVRLGDDATSTMLATSATHRLTRLVLNDSYATDTLTIDNNIDLGNASITCRFQPCGAATSAFARPSPIATAAPVMR